MIHGFVPVRLTRTDSTSSISDSLQMPGRVSSGRWYTRIIGTGMIVYESIAVGGGAGTSGAGSLLGHSRESRKERRRDAGEKEGHGQV
jgi:hypothetical protein